MTLVTPHSCDNFNYFFTVKLNRTQTLASQSHRMKAYIVFIKFVSLVIIFNWMVNISIIIIFFYWRMAKV